MAARKELIAITGDRRLVEEFAVLSKDKFSVVKSGKICAAVELTNSDRELKKKNLMKLERIAGPSALILSSSVTVMSTVQAGWLRRPENLVGISAFPTLLGNELIELAPVVGGGGATGENVIRRTGEFFAKIGKNVAVVQDRVGMVMPRILCMVINEAAFALGEQLASARDIDSAMQSGTNYPFGPVEWMDRIGPEQVVAVLDALYEDLHEERYRVAPVLRQLTSGKKWWGS
jgi:3-hydroxybutyryl-CoA dehydrogenase